MTDDSGSYNKFKTKIPLLSEEANIREALQVFLYGSVDNAAANDDSLTATDGSAGLVGHLQALENVIPTGIVLMWSGSSVNVPDGWLLCDGSTFSAATYPDLNTHLGGTTLPNLTDRFVRGNTTSGGTGGSKTITISNMPSHSHGDWNGSYYTNYTNTGTVSSDHAHHNKLNYGSWHFSAGTYVTDNFAVLRGYGSDDVTYGITANHTHGVTINYNGWGTDYLPKYYDLCYIIKT